MTNPTQVLQPFQFFADSAGDPVDAGYIYIGLPNLDPRTNPTAVYWDYDLTIPAPQPIRTSGGHPVWNGAARRFFVDGDYSIVVLDRNGSLLYSLPTANVQPLPEPIPVDDFATKVGVQNQLYTAFETTGTAPDFLLATIPSFAEYASNQRFRVKFTGESTTPTISVNGVGAKSIKQYNSAGTKIAATIKTGQLADLEYDGVDFVVLNPLPPSLPTPTSVQLKVVKFSSSGTFVAPQNVTKAIVTLCGGGGGGGGRTIVDDDPDYARPGYGGYPGEVVYRENVSLTPLSSYPIVIGAGGAGGAGGYASTPNGVNGGDGGGSSFGSILSAAGGLGGRAGIPAEVDSGFGNPGGANGISSIIGLGGMVPRTATINSGPINGAGPGGGGSGDYKLDIGTFESPSSGGVGAAGICIIEYIEA